MDTAVVDARDLVARLATDVDGPALVARHDD
jgi:hypothetical protein